MVPEVLLGDVPLSSVFIITISLVCNYLSGENGNKY